MKASYKIALVVSAVVCILAVVVFTDNSQPEPEQPVTEPTTQTPDNQRSSLHADSQGDGSLKSLVESKTSTAPTTKPGSIASDARERIRAANAAKSAGPDTTTDTTKPKTASNASIGDNSSGNLALARTDNTAVKPVTKPAIKPAPETKVSSQALDAVLGNSTANKEPASTSNNKPKPDAIPATNNAPTTYTVQPGDVFSSIAVKLYDDERRWVDIAQANPSVDPTKLKVGQILRLPGEELTLSKEEPAPKGPGDIQTHKIRPGDSLSTVAEKYYGDPTLWRTIYNYNRRTIGDNPNAIKTDMILEIPPRITGAQ